MLLLLTFPIYALIVLFAMRGVTAAWETATVFGAAGVTAAWWAFLAWRALTRRAPRAR